MKIIEYFSQDQKQHWIEEIKKSDWGAAETLVKFLTENTFDEMLGDNGKLYLMTDNDSLVSFITLTRKDCIEDDKLFPWMGFLYTFPQYRGHRYSEQIINHAIAEAKRRSWALKLK